MIPYFLFDPRIQAAPRWRRPAKAVDWHPDLSFSPELLLTASSWPYNPLFDTPVVDLDNHDDGITWCPKGTKRHPGDAWGYRNVWLPKGEPLSTSSGRRRGRVWFDAGVAIPVLFRGRPNRVWMSHTPMEAFTLRAGIKKASGRVAIAGLGLGYQLREIAKKRSVKSIKVFEISQPLCNWYGQRLVEEISSSSGKPIELSCENAYDADFTGFDSVIFDIWASYREAADDDKWQRLKRQITRSGAKAWGWGDV